MQKVVAARSKADGISSLAAALTWDAIPAPLRPRAKLQILDALGTGLRAD